MAAQQRTRSEVVALVQPQEVADLRYDYRRTSYSLGCAALAAALRRDTACDVTFIDAAAEGFETVSELGPNVVMAGYTKEQFLARLGALGPDIVGVSVPRTPQYPCGRLICEWVKEYDPMITTVMGGAHVTGGWERVIREPAVDYVVLGEGEAGIVGLVEHLRGHRAFEDVVGVARCQDGVSFISGGQRTRPAMDSLPDPDYTIFRPELYANERFHPGIIRGRRPVDYLCSRGCPGRCDFCCTGMMSGSRLRCFSQERISSQLHSLRSQGFDEILLLDDDLLLRPELAEWLFQFLADLGVRWSYLGGVNRTHLTERLARMMGECGCDRVYFAIESPNEQVLRRHGKYKREEWSRLPDTPGMISILTEVGVETSGGLMIGFPEETKEDIERTVSYGKYLRDEAGLGTALFFCATPYPGTRFFQHCLRQGYLTHPERYEDYTFEKGNITTPNFTADEITQIRLEAMRRVNGDDLFSEMRERAHRPQLPSYYRSHPDYRWSKFFTDGNAAADRLQRRSRETSENGRDAADGGSPGPWSVAHAATGAAGCAPRG